MASPILVAFARANVAQTERESDTEQEQPEVQRDGIVAWSKKRNVQHVATKQEKKRVLKWMIADEAENGLEKLMSRTFAQFPGTFRGGYHANFMRAKRWWFDREALLNADEDNRMSMNFSQVNVSRKVLLKAKKGRGRKTEQWVLWLHEELRSEFDRLRKAGVKFSPRLLKLLAKLIVKDSIHPIFSPTFLYNSQTLGDCITDRWIRRFMEKNDIVGRAQTGKLMVSAERQEHIEKEIAYHLGVVAREFQSGLLDESMVENVDETHFVINMDNGKTLGFRGDSDVKYADVVSGGIGMTMVVRLTGGPQAIIETPMIIFQNERGHYPIRGVDDNVVGVCYRSSRRGFMTSQLWKEWLDERRVQRSQNQGSRTRVIWCDNYGAHNDSPAIQESLLRLKAVIRKLPACSTDKVQPCDSFVIAKIKEAWRNSWDEYKMSQISTGEGMSTSGALRNPGKHFFLKLAASSVRKVNAMRDKKGMTYARKAMIRCGLSLDTNGLWHEGQLSPELQTIVRRHRLHFGGLTVPRLGSIPDSQVVEADNSVVDSIAEFVDSRVGDSMVDCRIVDSLLLEN